MISKIDADITLVECPFCEYRWNEDSEEFSIHEPIRCPHCKGFTKMIPVEKP